MSGSVFRPGIQYAGCDNSTRRALRQTNMEAPHILKLVEAARGLKYKHVSPAYKNDTWAHLGFPDIKIAVIARHETAAREAFTARWAKHGWKMLAVSPGALNGGSVEDLTRQLGDAILELRAKK